MLRWTSGLWRAYMLAVGQSSDELRRVAIVWDLHHAILYTLPTRRLLWIILPDLFEV